MYSVLKSVEIFVSYPLVPSKVPSKVTGNNEGTEIFFPKNILIGNVLDIKNISASEKEIVIKLKVNPITENLFGIVVSS